MLTCGANCSALKLFCVCQRGFGGQFGLLHRTWTLRCLMGSAWCLACSFLTAVVHRVNVHRTSLPVTESHHFGMLIKCANQPRRLGTMVGGNDSAEGLVGMSCWLLVVVHARSASLGSHFC